MRFSGWKRYNPYPKSFSIIALLLSLCSCVGIKPAPESTVPFDTKITQGKLSNDLTYYIRPNHYPENRVYVDLLIRAGSLQEEDNQQGIAHFIEHLVQEDTEYFPERKATDFMESIGMPFGSHFNAWTTYGSTKYMFIVPTEKPEILDQAFLLVRDTLTGASFTEKSITQERGAVIEEIRLDKNKHSRLNQQYKNIRLKGSRYLARAPLGKQEQVKAFERDDFINFYRKWYRPDNAAVIISGDVTPEQARELLEKHLGNIPKPSVPVPEVKKYRIPEIRKLQSHTLTDPELTSSEIVIDINYGESTPSLKTLYTTKQDDIIMVLLNNRLQEKSRESEPAFLQTNTWQGKDYDQSQAVEITSRIEADKFRPALSALMREIERIRQHGFTESELERILLNRVSTLKIWLDNQDATDSSVYLSGMADYFLYGETPVNLEQQLALEKSFQQQLTRKQLHLRARQLLNLNTALIWFSGPEEIRGKTPSQPDIQKLINEIRTEKLSLWQDKLNGSSLMTSAPDSTEPLKLQHHAETDIYEWLFPNGSRVLFKPTEFKADEILMHSWSPGGTSAIPDDLYRSALIAPDIAAESGLSEYNAAEVEKLLAGEQVSLTTYVDDYEHGAHGWSNRSSLETYLQLLYLSYTAPRIDPVIIQNTQQSILDYLNKRQLDPEEVFQDEIKTWLYNNHPYARPWMQDDVKKISATTTQSAYSRLHTGVNGVTFILLGNEKPERVQTLVSRYIGALPGKNAPLSAVDQNMRPRDGNHRFTRELLTEPRADVTILLHRYGVEWNENDARLMESLSEVLRSRLFNTLRVEQAAVYDLRVDSFLSNGPVKQFRTYISFSCAPEKVDTLIQSTRDEIKALQQVSTETQNQWTELVSNEVERLEKRQQENLKENSWWLGRIYYAINHNIPLNNLAEGYPPPSLDDIKPLARKYLQQANSIEAVLAPKPQIVDNQPAAAAESVSETAL